MRHIKHELIVTLIKALHEANLADVESGYESQNDLDPRCNQQDDLYGHLSNALNTLGAIGFNARECYVETGSADEAVEYVNDYYTARTERAKMQPLPAKHLPFELTKVFGSYTAVVAGFYDSEDWRTQCHVHFGHNYTSSLEALDAEGEMEHRNPARYAPHKVGQKVIDSISDWAHDHGY